MTYVKQNKWKVFATVFLFGALFFAFNTVKSENQESPELRQRKLLSTIGQLLESEHYSPRNIDDAFSKEVFNAYLKALDPEKNTFLQTDLDGLTKYSTTIDDEIHGATISFQPAVSRIYEIRIKETQALFNQIMDKPFDFSKDDSVLLNTDKLGYPKDEVERAKRWEMLLKYRTIERYASLIDEREKNKGKEKFVIKNDSTLEAESRAYIKKSYKKRLESFEKTFTKEKRFELFLNAITGLMDPHTDYLAPIEKRSFTEQMSGVIYGIGAQLTQDDFGIRIASIQPGGPAWKSGQIVVNDVIVKIAQGADEPVDVSGYETTDAVKLIRGNLGTEVRLTFRKPDGTFKVVSLIREKIVLDEGYARSVVIQNGEDKYGYILLPDFYADFEREEGHRCSEDVAAEIKKLKAENVKGIIIDVRFNGGGSLYEVVQMAGLFIDKGPVVQIRNKEGRAQTLYDETPGILYDGPLVVMANEFSASASEIFAGAMQDYKRGIVVGSSSTYGKGTVQRNVAFGKPLDSLGIQTEYGSVKLTFQKFYRISGSSTQKKGVVPDVILPDEYEYLKYREKDNESALSWDEMERARYNVWPNNAQLSQVVQVTNSKLQNDTALNKFKQNLLWVSSQIETPVYLKLDKYQAFKKRIQEVSKQNEQALKLKTPMKLAPIKVDYNKFYNNPDKSKQDRYQAWIKDLAKDFQVNESSKILAALNKKTTAVVKK
ncbi:MAG: carboxy terminal-processing peptidase [Chitinophagaceae bacterium]|nr:carboxy terminal-processing peptidase [Chitinophagaceae bacterium]MCF8289285.1 carboxy terminal-processing peptidase [Chitinophagaceae bacterium]MCF8421856.1 carboxy terminal-processing peptidase [Chitinophagaceae bacterium]